MLDDDAAGDVRQLDRLLPSGTRALCQRHHSNGCIPGTYCVVDIAYRWRRAFPHAVGCCQRRAVTAARNHHRTHVELVTQCLSDLRKVSIGQQCLRGISAGILCITLDQIKIMVFFQCALRIGG
jgi:hypothetical protein